MAVTFDDEYGSGGEASDERQRIKMELWGILDNGCGNIVVVVEMMVMVAVVVVVGLSDGLSTCKMIGWSNDIPLSFCLSLSLISEFYFVSLFPFMRSPYFGSLYPD